MNPGLPTFRGHDCHQFQAANVSIFFSIERIATVE
jgi:hypothetical protein